MAGGTDYEALLASIELPDDDLPAKPAGPWTRDKLALLAYYITPFAKLCADKAGGWHFIDGFAGNSANQVEGFARAKGTAMIGLTATPKPTTATLVEQRADSAASLQERSTRLGYTNSVFVGDCNDILPGLIHKLENRRLPGLCVLDPYGLNLDWATIIACRENRQGSYPYELLVYFSTPGTARSAAVQDDRFLRPNERGLTRLFGNESWRSIAEEQRLQRIDGAKAASEYLGLYRSQLEGLGYRTLARPAMGTEGSLLYHMVFASANEAGLSIMGDAMNRAFGSTRPLPLF